MADSPLQTSSSLHCLPFYEFSHENSLVTHTCHTWQRRLRLALQCSVLASVKFCAYGFFSRSCTVRETDASGPSVPPGTPQPAVPAYGWGRGQQQGQCPWWALGCTYKQEAWGGGRAGGGGQPRTSLGGTCVCRPSLIAFLGRNPKKCKYALIPLCPTACSRPQMGCLCVFHNFLC